MWPIITEIDTPTFGTIPIPMYGMFIGLAFTAAFALIHLRASQAGIDPLRLIPAYVAAAVGGMTGARLMYAFSVDWERTLADPMSLFANAGFAVYGGLIGGALAVGAYVAWAKLPPWKVADIALPGVLIGMGVGRIGCFFAGCCHGGLAPTPVDPIGLLPDAFTGGQIWLSSTFPFVTNEVHGGVGRIHDLPLYPVQLWAVVGLSSLAGLMTWFWPRRRFDGQVAALSLMLEAPVRFLFETFRADHRGYVVSWEVSAETAARWSGMAQAGGDLQSHVMGLTVSQGIAVLFVALGVSIWLLRRNTPLDSTPAIVQREGDLLDELV